MEMQTSKILSGNSQMFEGFIIHSSITAFIFPREDESKKDERIHHEPPGVTTCLRSTIKVLWEADLYVQQQGLHSITLCVLLRVVKEICDRQIGERTYTSEDPIQAV